MKKSYLKQWIIAVFLLAIVLAAPLFAADFEITKVIEVGPADGVPFMGPLKWSPDGTQLAFFAHGYLMTSDTLGNGKQIMKMHYLPHRFEWLSKREIAVMLLGQTDAKKSFRIQIFDIISGADSIVVETEASRYSLLPAQEYDGPFKTAEGNLYFIERFGKLERTGAIQARYPDRYEPEYLEHNHIVRWGDDGLYSIRANLTDSLRIGPKPYKYMPHRPIMSHDGRFIADGGTLLRLEDSTFIVIDTALRSSRDTLAGCGVTFIEFIKTAPEVIFDISCDDGHKLRGMCVAVFNYNSGKLSFLDESLGIENATTPSCAPNGRMFAFLANDTLYIAWRKTK